MTTMEILVALGGLLVGYWVVANLVLVNKRERPAEQAAGSCEEPSKSGPPEPRQPWHVVLKLPRHATTEEIRAAYQSQSRPYHPDSVSDRGDELRDRADKRSKEIDAAYREAMRERGVGS